MNMNMNHLLHSSLALIFAIFTMFVYGVVALLFVTLSFIFATGLIVADMFLVSINVFVNLWRYLWNLRK